MISQILNLLTNHHCICKYTAVPANDDLLYKLITVGQAAASSSFLKGLTVIGFPPANILPPSMKSLAARVMSRRRQPIEKITKYVMVAMKRAMIDKLSVFEQMGIDRVT